MLLSDSLKTIEVEYYKTSELIFYLEEVHLQFI